MAITCALGWSLRRETVLANGETFGFGAIRICSRKIKTGCLYARNGIIPPELKVYLVSGQIPTCLFCAIQAYGEFFDGPEKWKHLRPKLRVEDRLEVRRGLVGILNDVREIQVTESQPFLEGD